MNIQQILNQLLARQSLSDDAMRWVMNAILNGELDDIQIAGFLVALRAKGESVSEIGVAMQVMREKMTAVTINNTHAVDIVGTGGDGMGLFNVSTASAFVAAAAGVTIAKHGNRSVSSQSGAADVLSELGVSLSLNAEQTAACVNDVGIGFMFAPNHHSAMRFVILARKSLGIRTLFNILGPLCNPAAVKRQVIGVYSQHWLVPMAEALRELGAEHILLVHSNDGLDEISIADTTHVVELKQGNIERYQIAPEDFGMQRYPLNVLQVTNASESKALILSALTQEYQPLTDKRLIAAQMIALNAGAAIYVSGMVDSLAAGLALAEQTLQSGQALKKIEALATVSQNLEKTKD